jgi:GNAT superfamily N-acetyltransferase
MAATIYYLEMRDPAAFRPSPCPPGFEVTLVDPPDPALNRRFYRAVGAQWKWTDRLQWSEEQWRRCVQRDSVATWLARLHDRSAGYFELESQDGGSVELVYLGLLPEYIGRGLGGPLLSAAVQQVWDLPGTRRLWVHTCTDDHRNALGNYLKRGFRIYRTS